MVQYLGEFGGNCKRPLGPRKPCHRPASFGRFLSRTPGVSAGEPIIAVIALGLAGVSARPVHRRVSQ